MNEHMESYIWDATTIPWIWLYALAALAWGLSAVVFPFSSLPVAVVLVAGIGMVNVIWTQHLAKVANHNRNEYVDQINALWECVRVLEASRRALESSRVKDLPRLYERVGGLESMGDRLSARVAGLESHGRSA